MFCNCFRFTERTVYSAKRYEVLCTAKKHSPPLQLYVWNYWATVELRFFNATVLHWKCPFNVNVSEGLFSHSCSGENVSCHSVSDQMATMTPNKRTCISATESVSAVAGVKRFVLRPLRSRWVADLYSVCRASRLCLPPILLLRKELAYCQRQTESHYFTTDNTTGNANAVFSLCATARMQYTYAYYKQH